MVSSLFGWSLVAIIVGKVEKEWWEKALKVSCWELSTLSVSRIYDFILMQSISLSNIIKFDKINKSIQSPVEIELVNF
jgi:hypothetical protein